MKRYIAQLLTDLESATRNAPASSSYRFQHPFEEDDLDLSNYQLRYTRLNELFGLQSGIFPPSERLTKDHLSSLLTAIENLWRAWSISWDCPPRLSARRRYTIMVERMEKDSVKYHYELGADINFCDRRADGQCPFGDHRQCWCIELDASVQHDLDILESSRDFGIEVPEHKSPLDELQQWLHQHKPELPPWELDDQTDNWQQLTDSDENLAWLFFYDAGHANFSEPEADPEPTPEDFEDFDWHSDADEFDDLPF